MRIHCTMIYEKLGSTLLGLLVKAKSGSSYIIVLHLASAFVLLLQIGYMSIGSSKSFLVS